VRKLTLNRPSVNAKLRPKESQGKRREIAVLAGSPSAQGKEKPKMQEFPPAPLRSGRNQTNRVMRYRRGIVPQAIGDLVGQTLWGRKAGLTAAKHQFRLQKGDGKASDEGGGECLTVGEGLLLRFATPSAKKSQIQTPSERNDNARKKSRYCSRVKGKPPKRSPSQSGQKSRRAGSSAHIRTSLACRWEAKGGLKDSARRRLPSLLSKKRGKARREKAFSPQPQGGNGWDGRGSHQKNCLYLTRPKGKQAKCEDGPPGVGGREKKINRPPSET